MKTIEGVEVQDTETKKEMPGVGEFVTSKLSDAFSSLGVNFSKGKEKINTKVEEVGLNTELNRTAKKIGQYVVEEIKNGRETIVVPHEMIQEVRSLLDQLNNVKDRYNEI